MSEWLVIASPRSEPWIGLIVDSAWKGAAIFAASAVLALVLRRGTPAARHLVWSFAVAAAVGLPVLSASLPTWVLPLPVPRAAVATTGGRGPRPAALLGPVGGFPSARRFEAPPAAIGEPGPTTTESPVETPPTGREPAETPPPRWRTVPVRRCVPWIWAAGAVLSLLPTVAGLLSLRQLGRSARTVSSGLAHRLLEGLAGELGLRRPVRLVRSGRRTMPMTWGAWRPVILLPKGSETWTEERLEMILSHELAHVKRWDFATQILARLACSFHWFNPLAWMAAARARVEQELACDDVALGRGIEPTVYAGHLLAVLSRSASQGRGPSVASAMASASGVERRLRSILDPTRDRPPLARRRVVLAALGSACLLAVLATGRLGSAVAGPTDEGKIARSLPPGLQEKDDVLEQLRRHHVKPPDEATLIDGAIKGMVDALNDPYSSYIRPSDVAALEAQVRGTLTGIGARLATAEGRVKVEGTLPDSPAQKAGIRPGDAILEVDARPTRGIELREVVKWIVGAPGTVVRLKIARRDGRDVLLDITRSSINFRTVEPVRRGDGGRQEWMIDPEHKIGYARVSQFGSATPGELREAIGSLKDRGMLGMILDLRSCPGGLLEAAVEVANLFLPEGPIVTVRGRDGTRVVSKADPKKSLGDFPLVVLIDERTTSAGEVVAGALQDRNRAVLIGTRTFGKGSVQTIIKLKDGGGALKLTTASYFLPGGRNIDRVEGKPTWGIDPNDGDFVPMDSRDLDAILKRRDLDLAGEGAETPAAPDDLPLSAARKAMVARLTTGEFSRVGQPQSALALHVRRVEEMRRQRDALIKDLEKVDRELDALNRTGAARERPGEKG